MERLKPLPRLSKLIQYLYFDKFQSTIIICKYINVAGRNTTPTFRQLSLRIRNLSRRVYRVHKFKKGFKTLSWILRFDFKRISFVNLSILDFISENQCHSELQSSFVLSFMDAHKSYIFTLKIIQYVVKKRFIRILVFQLV